MDWAQIRYYTLQNIKEDHHHQKLQVLFITHISQYPTIKIRSPNSSSIQLTAPMNKWTLDLHNLEATESQKDGTLDKTCNSLSAYYVKLASIYLIVYETKSSITMLIRVGIQFQKTTNHGWDL